MQISMYNVLVPTVNRMLGNVLVLFDKAEAFVAQKKIEPAVLLNSRLAPDMFALTRQVQIACDSVKGAAARLSGTEIPSHPDTETSFADLRARIGKTLDFINGIDAAKYAGSEDRDIVLNMRTGELRFKGLDYLLHFVLPNFYFHATTIYAILRHNGVELGKQDFLGKP
ncbi:MAG TPA: DUF1993 family protein [Rudaea sp.]|jgi:hypothetical protein|uniref:DUF1993 domain-containing protein n=1 Tax=Rudaea sp. TaxID=2136325 RepID=UPI002F95A807